jgi:hypothetical protein
VAPAPLTAMDAGPRADTVATALAQVQGLSARERAVILHLLTPCQRAVGRSCTELSAQVPMLAGRDFPWPEFDRWQAFFAARQTFPVRWDGLRVVPAGVAPESEAYHRRKLELLLEWLDALARRSAVFAHYARQGVGARVARQDDSCPVCAAFVARPVESDGDVMPPFHPGCRCVLLAVRAAPARRRTRGYRRVYGEAS